MGAKANFERSISDESYNSMGSSLDGISQNSYSYKQDFFNSASNLLGNIVEGVVGLIIAGTIIFSVFFFLYIVIILFTKGGEAAASQISASWKVLSSFFSLCFSGIKKFFINIYSYLLKRKALTAFLVLILFSINFLGNVVNGSSRILRLIKIEPGYVGVDLKNSKVIDTGFHLYSPLKSGFFLSPTNNFSFGIDDVEASAKEELSVTLDYSVTFSLTDNKRLELYKHNGAKNIRLISSDIVMPKILEVINGIIKDYSFKDISGKHSEIKAVTIASANTVFSEIGITIEDLNILSIKLPDSYMKSKEDLLKAENELKLSQASLDAQKKLSEKKLLEAQNNKAVKIIEAEAISEYTKIISGQELTPAMIEMKKLEIEEKKVEKWDGKLAEGGSL